MKNWMLNIMSGVLVIAFIFGSLQFMYSEHNKKIKKIQEKPVSMYIIKYYNGGKLISEYDSIKSPGRYDNKVVFKYHGKEVELKDSYTIEEK
jgi:surface polysaccharide O-acyltransferase-like enzyme